MTTLAHLWAQLTAVAPAAPPWDTAVTAAVALAIVASRRSWRLSRTVVTLAHEGGHAVVSVAAGRQLEGIRLHSDTSGVTSSRGKARGPGLVLTVAAGYATPPLAGAAAAWLLSAGHVTALLWAVLVFLAVAFAAIRNAFGVLAVLAVAGLVYAISRYASVAAQDAFAYLFTWFLLFGGVRAVAELRRRRRGGWDQHSDADQLARLTGVPAGAWVALFGLLGLAALAGSVLLLVPLPALPR